MRHLDGLAEEVSEDHELGAADIGVGQPPIGRVVELDQAVRVMR